MNIEIRPSDGICVIGEECSDCMMFHLYCEDESENGICIILTEEQMRKFQR